MRPALVLFTEENLGMSFALCEKKKYTLPSYPSCIFSLINRSSTKIILPKLTKGDRNKINNLTGLLN